MDGEAAIMLGASAIIIETPGFSSFKETCFDVKLLMLMEATEAFFDLSFAVSISFRSSL